jgi:hypothetical protein
MIKTSTFINDIPLKKEITKCMVGSKIHQGWFIGFDKGATLIVLLVNSGAHSPE